MRSGILAAVVAWVMALPASAAAACPSEPVLAMTYNIRLDTSADGEKDWAHRKAMFIAQVGTLRPELLGMQEVLPNQKRDLQAAFPHYAFVGAGRDDGKEAGEASPLAISRRAFRIVSSGTFWLSPTPDRPSFGWDAGYRRVATWAHLVRRGGGGRLLVVNTHWDNSGLTARRESGAQILNWIERNRGKRELLVLLGDLNADNTEASVQQLTQPRRGSLLLKDARLASQTGSSGPPFSFNAFDAFATSGKLIDHIFVSPEVAVRSHAVIAQHELGRVASDHYPVAALLEFPGSSLKATCPGG